MNKNKIPHIIEKFNHVLQITENVEYWYARDLMPLFGYERWENSEKVVYRSIESYKTSEISDLDHFREVAKMVALGSGAKREIKDFILEHRVKTTEKQLAKKSGKLPIQRKNDGE
ncbi:MAG: hypothetical protein ACRC4W_05010 [Treponemataceae bacterium]